MPSLNSWGGFRPGAGRPKLENPRKLRALKFNDTEWEAILRQAKVHRLSPRAYLASLVSKDARQK